MRKIIPIFALLVLLTGLVDAAFQESTLLSISLVNQDPDPAIAGDVLEIRLGIENNGGSAAENLMVEVVPEYPFSMVAGESHIKDVGTIMPYQVDDERKIVKFKLMVDRDASAGQYELKVKDYEEGQQGTYVQRSFSIDIKNKESAEVIYIDQVELIPGKITPLKFTVNNVGSAPLRDLTFQWENEDDIILPVGSDNTKYIKHIDIGESAELKFDVIASATADPDLYKLDLSLKYDDPITGEEKEIATKAGIYVGGATDFDAAFSGSSSGEYSFAISNIGSVSASSVTVRVPDQPGWRVSGSNSVIIGNLNEGDYTIASFKLTQSASREQFTPGQTPRTEARNATAMQDSNLMLEIVYTDTRGNRNTIEKEVPVDVPTLLTAEEGNFPSINGRRQTQNPLAQAWKTLRYVLLGILVVIIFIVVRRRYNKGKLDDKDYSYGKAIRDLFKKRRKKKG
ncbi:MAG: COG1361 S-layer family protein [Nanoarchaeota archaeon]|nr:COG1361 S-layer family protein [Nanoarchaeota archaeon]